MQLELDSGIILLTFYSITLTIQLHVAVWKQGKSVLSCEGCIICALHHP